MPLSPGTRLGPYEIAATLGAGGMGVVYRARDSKLHRDVAIKVLPDLLAGDPERRARLQREAQTLAALNHPNIAHIYGVEEQDGQLALVMELVEGPTIADLIVRGGQPGLSSAANAESTLRDRRHRGLPVDEAIRIARQIADALEAAHTAGIVHRDLKPANIKVRPDGLVKVLDFGLARIMPDPVGGTANADSPTLTVASPAATAHGVILGTAAYMAPEQAQGRVADARSDLWAFGVVLFEMLAGAPLFHGRTVTDVLASVLRDAPDWTALPPETPPHVRRLLNRCLQKDPQLRWRHAGDARLELADDADASGSAPVPKSRRSVRLLVLAPLVVGAVAGGMLIGRQWALPTEPPRPVRFTLPPPPRVAWNYWGTPSVSPDGQNVAIGATSPNTGERAPVDPQVFSIWIRPVDGLDFRRIEGVAASNDAITAWSADGRWVVFPEGPHLKRATSAGGAVEVICPLPAGKEFTGATVNAEGTVLVGFSIGPLHRVPLSGGTLQPVGSLDSARGELAQTTPHFLPDGRRYLFASRTAGTEAVVAAALDSSERTEVVSNAGNPLYAAPGLLLFRQEGRFMAQRFNASRLAPEGEPAVIEAQRQPETMAVSGTGTLVYRAQIAGPVRRHGEVVDGNTRLAWFDRNGRELERIGAPGAYVNVELSPDNRWIAVEKFDNANDGDIWIYDARRGLGTRLTSHPLRDSDPLWSPRGDRIAWARSSFDGTGTVWIQRADASGQPATVPTKGIPGKPGGPYVLDWSPDGQYLAALWIAGSGVGALEIVPVGSNPPVAWPASQFSEGALRFSPDGRWIAHVSYETGSPEVYVQRFPPVGRKVRVSFNGGMQPSWRRDGKELYYLAPDRTLMSVAVRDSPAAPDFGEPAPLFRAPVPMPSWGRSHYQATADGSRFLLTVLDSTQHAPSPDVVVVLDWARTMYDELGR